MFDRLFDFIVGIIDWFKFAVIVREPNRAIVLRWGKYRRTIFPGFHFVLPFGIDEVEHYPINRQTTYLDVQSLTSADSVSFTITGIVIYKIVNLRRYLLNIEDGETDVQNFVYASIAENAEICDWEYIVSEDFGITVFDRAQEMCNIAGVEILQISFADKTRARSIRLWND